MRHIALVLVVLAVVGNHDESRAAELRRQELLELGKAYIANVFGEPPRTLREYYAFESPTTEYEERFIVACELRNPMPRSLGQACLERLRDRDSERAPSMYLLWLRSRLPARPHHVAVVRVRRVNRGTPFEGDEIRVDVNGVALEFFRADDRTGTGPEMGRFGLVSIGGTAVSRLIDRDLAAARKDSRR